MCLAIVLPMVRQGQATRLGTVVFSSRDATDYQLLFGALSIVTIPVIAIYVIFNGRWSRPERGLADAEASGISTLAPCGNGGLLSQWGWRSSP